MELVAGGAAGEQLLPLLFGLGNWFADGGVTLKLANTRLGRENDAVSCRRRRRPLRCLPPALPPSLRPCFTHAACPYCSAPRRARR